MIIFPVQMKFTYSFFRTKIHKFFVKRHANIAKNIFEIPSNILIFRREENFITVPLFEFVNNCDRGKFSGGGIEWLIGLSEM